MKWLEIAAYIIDIAFCLSIIAWIIMINKGE